MSKPAEPVYFHPEQLKYLEKVFPKVVHSASATEAELRHANGIQVVIEFIRGKQRSN